MNIIPRPNHLVRDDAPSFVWENGCGVWFAPQLAACKEAFCAYISENTCVPYIEASEEKAAIRFYYNAKRKAEGYTLAIASHSIIVTASSAAGAFYAIQSLRLLLEADLPHKRYTCPCMHIQDAPAFAWRGVHLDSARHFTEKDEVLKIMHMMALCKMNVLHMHLTDDQGFRIPIQKYPEINRVSTLRHGTQLHFSRSEEYDMADYAAQYTREDIAEIVAFGKQNHIRVVPEFDIPGHCLALIAAMPQLSCKGEKLDVWPKFGISDDILCAGKAEVYTVIKDIIDEIITLFDPEYIHLGGDEAPKKRWEQCPHCQAKIKALGLADEHALQAHMFNELSAYALSKGVKVIGWNECLNDQLDIGVINEHWFPKNLADTTEHLNRGRATIFSYYNAYYFDFPYAGTPMNVTYQQDIVPKGTPKDKAKQVLGIECCAWSEWLRRRENLEYHLFPRLFAVAERAWTRGKNYAAFIESLGAYRPLLEAKDICYAKQVFTNQRYRRSDKAIKEFYYSNGGGEFERMTGLANE